jgi:hypothetical protein
MSIRANVCERMRPPARCKAGATTAIPLLATAFNSRNSRSARRFAMRAMMPPFSISSLLFYPSSAVRSPDPLPLRDRSSEIPRPLLSSLSVGAGHRPSQFRASIRPFPSESSPLLKLFNPPLPNVFPRHITPPLSKLHRDYPSIPVLDTGITRTVASDIDIQSRI